MSNDEALKSVDEAVRSQISPYVRVLTKIIEQTERKILEEIYKLSSEITELSRMVGALKE